MSAIRTNKADARSARFIAPYTRWFSRILGVRSSDDSKEHVKSSTSVDDSTSGSRISTSHALTSEHQPSNLESKQPQHLTPAQYSTPSKTISSSSSASPPDVVMDNVASFLSHSAGQSVSAEEVEGMLAMLRSNSSQEPREIFRFSSTPTRDIQSSPSTPLTTPKKLPRNPNGVYRWEGAGSAKHSRPRNRYASPAFAASPSKQDRSAVKEGVDSQDMPLPDSKRRRVGDESSSSSVSTQRSSISEPPSRKLPFPSIVSPTPGTNGVGNRPNSLPSPSRLRSPVKPTSPVVPSPLRQTWSEPSAISSQNETRKTPPQTKTANFMAELIKETTPPKKPDLANPYQLASPVGKVGPPRRSTKRPRATGRPVSLTKVENEEKGKKEETKEKEKLMEYSPQTIIEATVPKGSQRSRPPAHFEKPTDTSITEEESSQESSRPQCETPVVETSKITYVVEEVDDDEAEEVHRSAKRTKVSINGHSPIPTAFERTPTVASESEIKIDILEDIDMDAAEHKEQSKLIIPIIENGSSPTSTSPTNISPTASRNKLSSVPKEPSKLRFSFQPEGTSAPSTPTFKPAVLPAPSPGLPKSDFKFEPPSSNFNFSFKANDVSPTGSPKPQEQAKNVKVKDKDTNVDDIKAKARAMTPSSLPTFVMTSSATSILPSSVVARVHRRVNDLPVSSLPNFELSSGTSTSSTPFKSSTSSNSTTPFNSSTSSKSSTPFSFGFDPANPKPKPFPFGSGGSPFNVVGNNSSPGIFGVNSTPTPPVLEAADMKKNVESGVPVVKAFDFAAGGMKTPPNNSGSGPSKSSTPFSFGFDPANPKPKLFPFGAGSSPPNVGKNNSPQSPGIFGVNSTPTPPVFEATDMKKEVESDGPVFKGFGFAAGGMKTPSNNPESGPSKSSTPFSFGFDPSNSKPKPFTFGPSVIPLNVVGGNNSSPGVFGMNNTPTPPILEATDAKKNVESDVPVFKGFDFAAGGRKTPSNNPESVPSKSSTPFSFGFDPSNSKPKPFTFGSGVSPPNVVGGNNSTSQLFGIFGVNNNPTPPVVEATDAKKIVESGVPVFKGFDFAAAGMKAPSNNPGIWICSLCALSNPSSALKCETCDTPAISTSAAAAAVAETSPSAPSPTPPQSGPPAVPVVKAFDFAAAGMKAPTVNSGTWICSLCALTNPMSANQCETCETTRVSFS